MLNSGLEYLEDLRKKYQDKLGGSDLNLLDEPNLNVDEDKVNEIIDTIRNQGSTNQVPMENPQKATKNETNARTCKSNKQPIEKVNTPNQNIKMTPTVNIYDSNIHCQTTT